MECAGTIHEGGLRTFLEVLHLLSSLLKLSRIFDCHGARLRLYGYAQIRVGVRWLFNFVAGIAFNKSMESFLSELQGIPKCQTAHKRART